jgi:hypothetical protein
MSTVGPNLTGKACDRTRPQSPVRHPSERAWSLHRALGDETAHVVVNRALYVPLETALNRGPVPQSPELGAIGKWKNIHHNYPNNPPQIDQFIATTNPINYQLTPLGKIRKIHKPDLIALSGAGLAGAP